VDWIPSYFSMMNPALNFIVKPRERVTRVKSSSVLSECK
jgi:hypothetical protein